MIFEGEYLNGTIWNWKCREYNNVNKLIFDGVYKNGEKIGKYYKYDSNGNLIFEGEYFKGKKNGKCKEYNSDGT